MASLRPSGPDTAEIVILQEFPEKKDIMDNEHCASASGRYLRNVLYRCGIPNRGIWYDYLTPVYPGYRGIVTQESQDSVATYRKELISNLKKLPNLKLIIGFGKNIMTEFGIKLSIESARGYLFDVKKLPAPLLITYRPYKLFVSGLQKEVTFLNDINKAARIVKTGRVVIDENFNLEPTLQDVYNYCRDTIRNKENIYTDIESFGALNDRDFNTISIVGIGRKSDMSVLVIPFRVQGGGYYWSDVEQMKIKKWLRLLFSFCGSTCHNAGFDLTHLNYQEFGPVKLFGDTLLLHHALHPELPHGLDYVSSIYTDLSYWKNTLKEANHQLELDNIEFRRYNAYDVLSMMLIDEQLIQENKEQGTYKIYEKISLPLLEAALILKEKGMPVDVNKLNNWIASLKREQTILLKKISSSWNISKDFNFNSDDQMRWLFYKQKPKKWNEKKQAYLEYDNPSEGKKKKSKNTKKFKTLEEYIFIYKNTEPFLQLSKLNIKETNSGSISVDEEMRLRVHEAILGRLYNIKNLKRRTEKHDIEERKLKNMLIVVECLGKYNKNEKLLNTYTKFHIEPDGCVHGSYKVTGTRTGRLASEGPNMQNIPPAAKKIFVAPKGFKFMQFDYTNLELVVLAYMADIPYLIDIFKRGLNVHDINTEKLFHITKNDEKWDTCRRIMKTIEFGRNYGGSIKGIYHRMLAQNPGVRISFEEFKEMDAAYFGNMPEYFVYEKNVLNELKTTRKLKNAFGRIRIFLGTDSKIIREGLNFPIQSTASDIMAIGIKRTIAAWKKLTTQGCQFYPCATVHDSLVFLVPDNEISLVLKVMKKCLTAPLKIGKHTVGFNGEVTISQSYKAVSKKEYEEKKLDYYDEIIGEDLEVVLKKYVTH